jgi:hypothetical protein
VERRHGYVDVSKLSPGEALGMLSGLVLLGSLWLPWFSTSASNPNSHLHGASHGASVSAWDTFPILRWLLLAACVAPFILSWIIARGHKLTWRPGEVTMVVGITAFILIISNGIVLGKPHDSGDTTAIGISLDYGYLIALIASIGMAVAGYLRQAYYSEGRRPPGTF